MLPGLVVIQLGVEAVAVVVPQLAKELSGSFMSLSMLSTVSFAALGLGHWVGGAAVERHGLRRAYLASLTLRTAGAGLLWGLYRGGGLGVAALTGLFGLDYLLLGLGNTAQATLAKSAYGADPLAQSRFGVLYQLVIDGVGFVGPLAAGALIAHGGFGAVLRLYPFAMLGATLLAAAGVRNQAAEASERPDKSEGGRRFARAWGALRAHPSLGVATAAFAAISASVYWLYLMVAPAYGLYLAGTPEAAAGVAAAATSFFAGGGIAGSFLVAALNRRLDKAAAARPAEAREAKVRGAYHRLAAACVALTAAGLVGAWAFTSRTTVLGLPPAAWAMAPAGLASTAAYVTLDALIKSETPKELGASVLGLARAGATALAVGGFFLLGKLFAAFSTASGAPLPQIFVWVGISSTAGALLLLLAAVRLWREGR